jgi:hypothetical protein
MTLAIGEIVRGVLSYSHPNGSVGQNVFYWENQDAAGDEDLALAEIADWAEDTWGAAWQQVADSNCVLYLLECDVLNADGTVDRNIGEEVLSTGGSITGDAMPAAVSAFIQASTERGNSKGRKYAPFIAEQEITEGDLIAHALGQMLLMGSAWLLDIPYDSSSTLVAGVLSRVLEQFLEFTGTVLLTDIPAYQRRRKENVGS